MVGDYSSHQHVEERTLKSIPIILIENEKVYFKQKYLDKTHEQKLSQNPQSSVTINERVIKGSKIKPEREELGNVIISHVRRDK